MSLNEKQSQFAQNLPRLIDRAYQLGFRVTLGDAFRDPRVDYGHPDSKHKKRLAIDLNLFRKSGTTWVYCTNTSDHEELGAYWVTLGGIWGGSWDDGNHYEWPL